MVTLEAASPDARVALVCNAGCHDARYDLLQRVHACPRCGGLLDPWIDLEALSSSAISADTCRNARGSGVWRFQDFFWPSKSVKSADIVTLGEGRAPLTALDAVAIPDDVHSPWNHLVGAKIHLKQCGQNPTGSFKDLGMTVLSTWARLVAQRAGGPRRLLCASTGDTSAALAAYGARAGVPVTVLLPLDKVSPAQLVQPLAHGAQVLGLEGDFDACMGVVAALAHDESVLLANSKNPLRLLGQCTVALELALDFLDVDGSGASDGPDVVLVPSGNLGNVYALWLGFTLAKAAGWITRIPQLVACQVDAANPLYRSSLQDFAPTSMTAGETLASAIRIGAPVSFPRAVRALRATNGFVTTSSEEALAVASAAADRSGHFVCPQTATALAGLAGAMEAGRIKRDANIVVVSTASGLKFAEQKADFHAGRLAVSGQLSGSATKALVNPIRPVACTVEAVRAAMHPGAPC